MLSPSLKASCPLGIGAGGLPGRAKMRVEEQVKHFIILLARELKESDREICLAAKPYRPYCLNKFCFPVKLHL